MEPREALCTQQSCDQDLRQRGGQEQGSRSAGRPLPGDALAPPSGDRFLHVMDNMAPGNPASRVPFNSPDPRGRRLLSRL